MLKVGMQCQNNTQNKINLKIGAKNRGCHAINIMFTSKLNTRRKCTLPPYALLSWAGVKHGYSCMVTRLKL